MIINNITTQTCSDLWAAGGGGFNRARYIALFDHQAAIVVLELAAGGEIFDQHRFVLKGLGAGAAVAEAAVGDFDGVAAAIHGLADLVVVGVIEENLIVALGIDGLGQAVVLFKGILGDAAQDVDHLDAVILEVVGKAGAAFDLFGGPSAMSGKVSLKC